MTSNARAAALRLADLLRAEHAAMAEFLLALADFDRRRAWLELGYTGLFHFLVQDLGLSKGAAYQRKVAAALLQRLPNVALPLRDERLCLSTIVEVARVVTPENQAEVLPRFFHRSAREAREVTAALCPVGAPARRDVVTKVGAARAEHVLTSELIQTGSQERPGHSTLTPTPIPTPIPAPNPTLGTTPTSPPTSTSTAAPILTPPSRRPSVEPLTADLRRLHLTVSRRFLEKLESVRHARSHARPDATSETILEEALDLLLDREARRRGHARRRRAEVRPTSSGDHVPAAIRAEVWARDEGRCQWPLEAGGCCGSTWQLELDHIRPRAQGGASVPANLRVLCRFHNQLAATQAFGADWMAQSRARPGLTG